MKRKGEPTENMVADLEDFQTKVFESLGVLKEDGEKVNQVVCVCSINKDTGKNARAENYKN